MKKIPAEFYEANGIAVNERGKARVNDKTLETSVEGVYLAGDGARGAATIVEAIRDAQLVAEAILGDKVTEMPGGLRRGEGLLFQEGNSAHSSGQTQRASAA